MTPRTSEFVRVIGRYALHGPIAAGGMATVHFGRLLGPVGFSRTVAIKRLHAQYAQDPEFVAMFLDEARLAARIRHPNVVPTLDVVATEGELFLVMEYVAGESLVRLTRGQPVPPLRILSAVMAGSLHGLHAAHEARDERGQPLGIVHRDVSPQNILVGTDGVPRVLDFGVAKASGRVQHTRDGQIKGKLSYMAPEQLKAENVSRQADIYAAGVILWELITGKRLFGGDNEGAVVAKILEGAVTPPSHTTSDLSRTIQPKERQQLAAVDRIVLRALNANPSARYATAREMAVELERVLQPATATEVGEWVEVVARDVLASRAGKIADIESSQSLDFNERLSGPDGVGVLASIPPISSTGGVPRAFVDMAPPVTQPSGISVSTHGMPDEPPRPHSSTRTILAAAGGLLVALLLVFGVVLAKTLHGRTDEAASQAPSEPADSVDAGAIGASAAAAPLAAASTWSEPSARTESRDAGPVAVETTPTVPTAATVSATGTAPSAATGSAPLVKPTITPNAGGRASAPKAVSTGGSNAATPKPHTEPPKSAPACNCNPPFTFEGGIKKYKDCCI